MALTYGFYNSVDHDRMYNAAQISSLFDGIINDGVFSSVGSCFQTTANAGMTINVGSGRAWFNRTWTNNDTLLPLVIETAHAILNRIDVVILEVDQTEVVRANSIKILKGTAATDPLVPALTNTELVHQYDLAQIYVGAGVTAITQDKITNRVGQGTYPLATGVMATITIDAFIAQWHAEFDTWFSNVQAQLEGNVVTNLQNQINLRLPLAGGTMTGNIILAGAPTADLHPSSKKYVDDIKSREPIGTIQTALANPWGAKGLLCNGAAVNQGTYPDLYTLSSSLVGGPWTANAIPATAPNMQVLNGYFIAFNGAQIYYKLASNPTGAWTTVATNIANPISHITYGNGYWCVQTSGTYQIWYLATAGAPTATWVQNTTHGIPTSGQTYGNLIYGGGYFITGYVQTNTTAVFYLAKKADPTGAWTTGINTNEYGGGGYVGTISYEPTTALFVIQGMYYDGSWLQCWLTSSSNLSTFNRAYQSSSEYVKTKCIQYYNGTWYGVHTTTGNGDGLVSASTLAGLGASSAGTKVSSLPSSYTLYGRVNGLWANLKNLKILWMSQFHLS
jgi:hypothetical protein